MGMKIKIHVLQCFFLYIFHSIGFRNIILLLLKIKLLLFIKVSCIYFILYLWSDNCSLLDVAY